MAKISYTNTVDVTCQDIDDIVCTAFEGGITYWCNRVEVVGELLGKYASDQISRGGKLKIYVDEPFDEDDTTEYELDRVKLLRGLQMYLAFPCKPCGITDISWRDGKKAIVIDTSNVDAEVADMIIQFALFKEIIYG